MANTLRARRGLAPPSTGSPRSPKSVMRLFRTNVLSLSSGRSIRRAAETARQVEHARYSETSPVSFRFRDDQLPYVVGHHRGDLETHVDRSGGRASFSRSSACIRASSALVVDLELAFGVTRNTCDQRMRISGEQPRWCALGVRRAAGTARVSGVAAHEDEPGTCWHLDAGKASGPPVGFALPHCQGFNREFRDVGERVPDQTTNCYRRQHREYWRGNVRASGRALPASRSANCSRSRRRATGSSVPTRASKHCAWRSHALAPLG